MYDVRTAGSKFIVARTSNIVHKEMPLLKYGCKSRNSIEFAKFLSYNLFVARTLVREMSDLLKKAMVFSYSRTEVRATIKLNYLTLQPPLLILHSLPFGCIFRCVAQRGHPNLSASILPMLF
jgi:hypothetical protein